MKYGYSLSVLDVRRSGGFAPRRWSENGSGADGKRWNSLLKEVMTPAWLWKLPNVCHALSASPWRRVSLSIGGKRR